MVVHARLCRKYGIKPGPKICFIERDNEILFQPVTRWQEVHPKLLGLPLEVVSADQSLAELAGANKAGEKMSLADCFAAALAI